MIAEASLEAEDFKRAICAAPDDDAPRLAFADWLYEQGDCDRAEYIKLAIELDPVIQRNSMGFYEAVANVTTDQILRYAALSSYYTENVRRSLQFYYSHEISDFHLRRGFVESVSLTASAYRMCARELIRATMSPIKKWSLTDIAIYKVSDQHGWAVGCIIYRSMDQCVRALRCIPFATPRFEDANNLWPSKREAESEFNYMLLEWAKGVDNPSFAKASSALATEQAR